MLVDLKPIEFYLEKLLLACLKPSFNNGCFFCSTGAPLFRRCEVCTDPPSFILEAHTSVLTPYSPVVTLHGLLVEALFKR